MRLNPKILYTARTHTKGGRARGVARSFDGLLDVRFAEPGSRSIGTNPEQLLAAGWSACFQTSLAIAARNRGIALPAGTIIEAEVVLALADDGRFLSVRLSVTLDGVDPKTAKALVDEAHLICPYSKATRGNVKVAIGLT